MASLNLFFRRSLAVCHRLPQIKVASRHEHNFVAPSDWDFSKKNYKPDRDRWNYYDRVVWPPHHTERGEPKKGEIFYLRENIKHSPLKLWYACQFVRNKPVDEAVAQLQYFARKSALIMRESLLEAQQKAVDEQKIEHRTDMYVAEAFAWMSMNIKGVRRHARARYGIVTYRYSNLYLRLEQGVPSDDRVRHPNAEDHFTRVDDYVKKLRDRRIEYGL